MALEPLHKESRETTHAPTPVEPIMDQGATHAVPHVPGDRLFAGSTFALQPAGTSVKDPDEVPLNWATGRIAPPVPFVHLTLAVDETPPARIAGAKPPRSREPSEPVHHTGHHRPVGLRPESELPDFADQRRQKYWNAFKAVCSRAETQHSLMGNDLEVFRHAENDPSLRALGYHLPSKEWKGSLGDLTDEQHVPLQNGVTVGSLFDGDNNLQMDKHDQRAIDGAGKAMKSGRGTIETKVLHTLKADTELKAKVKNVKARLDDMKSAASEARAAYQAIVEHAAGIESDEIRAEIESLKADANGSKEAADVLFALVTSAIYAATGEVGDAVDKIGVVASTLVGHVNDDRIEAAMNRLTQSEGRRMTAASAKLRTLLDSKRQRLSKVHGEFRTAGLELHGALTDRRIAYNELAAAAGKEIPCPERSRHKIAGMLAAIPLVEMVLSRVQTLRQHAPPAYNDASGRGMGMAAFHGMPVANTLRRACGELNFNKMTARLAEGEWTERLDALLEIKSRIIGPRPGDAR